MCRFLSVGLALHLKDVALAELGNEGRMPDGTWNFRKFRLLAGLFGRVLQQQQPPYRLKAAPHLLQWMENFRPYSDDQLEKASALAEVQPPTLSCYRILSAQGNVS
jgi:hypothetical protein